MITPTDERPVRLAHASLTAGLLAAVDAAAHPHEAFHRIIGPPCAVQLRR